MTTINIPAAVAKAKEIDPSLAPFIDLVSARVDNVPLPTDPDILMIRYRFDLEVRDQVGAFALVNDQYDATVAVGTMAERMRDRLCQRFGLEPTP